MKIMALRKAFCPNCGQPTQIDDTKDFCFCLSCGNKIVVPKREQTVLQIQNGVTEYEPRHGAKSQTEDGRVKSNDIPMNMGAPDDKLKEAEFYYNLSVEKEEYADANGEPTYYLKGQDLLIDLSQKFPSDYRVWWELCKPMDFAVVLEGNKSNNPTTINNLYFDKALDLAPLDQKMELVKLYDKYNAAKTVMLEEIRAEQERKEAEERARIEEEQRIQREAAEERQRQEKLRQHEEKERLRIERQEAEKKAAEFAQAQQDMSIGVWEALKNKQYGDIDNSYFRFDSLEGLPIIATFKIMANVLYLSAFHIDANKGNTVYLDQSIAIHFNQEGLAIKFDNKPVTVRGWQPMANTIRVIANPQGGFFVNNIQLVKDAAYVTSILKSAKKPILSLKKIFL